MQVSKIPYLEGIVSPPPQIASRFGLLLTLLQLGRFRSRPRGRLGRNLLLWLDTHWSSLACATRALGRGVDRHCLALVRRSAASLPVKTTAFLTIAIPNVIAAGRRGTRTAAGATVTVARCETGGCRVDRHPSATVGIAITKTVGRIGLHLGCHAGLAKQSSDRQQAKDHKTVSHSMISFYQKFPLSFFRLATR